MQDAGGSELLTLVEAGSILKLKTSTLRAWLLRRKIPYVKVGRLVRLRRADIERLISDCTIPAKEGHR